MIANELNEYVKAVHETSFLVEKSADELTLEELRAEYKCSARTMRALSALAKKLIEQRNASTRAWIEETSSDMDTDFQEMTDEDDCTALQVAKDAWLVNS